MPLVSVIVPNFNHASYLPRRLDSVYGQHFKDFEVLILDDCSTDNSRDIIGKYADHPSTTVILNSSNSGSVFRQWECGITKSDSEYIWIAESDDAASPWLLTELTQLLENDTEIGMAYCQSWLMGLDGQIWSDGTGWTDDIDPLRWKEFYVNDGLDEIRRCMTIKNTIPNASAVLIRRSALVKAGGVITENMRLCGDWLQWVRILAHSSVAYTPHRLNFWRQASSNARFKLNGILEWQEGELILNEACDIICATEFERITVKYKFLEKCFSWLEYSAIGLLNSMQNQK